MKQVEVEISNDYGFAHFGGQKNDEKGSSIEISDALADYLRPMLEDGLNRTTIEFLQNDLEEDGSALAEELSDLYYDIESLSSKMALEHCLENDKNHYDDDNLSDYRAKDIKKRLFVPSCANEEEFYEAHKDNYESPDDYEIEDDYRNAMWNEYLDWVDHLDDIYERAIRCFGEFSPMDGGFNWDYTILSIHE